MTPQQIEDKIRAHFAVSKIEVRDYTGGGDHYELKIESSAFKGMSRILRHRTIMQVFDAELKSGEIHALTIQATEPLE